MIQYDNKIIPEDIKERLKLVDKPKNITSTEELVDYTACLLYTSDAADDTPCVDLGCRRIIK
ncbi:hypothetical protein, partial [Staphylococcus aureus]